MDVSHTEVRFRNLSLIGKVGVGSAGLPTFQQDLINKGKVGRLTLPYTRLFQRSFLRMQCLQPSCSIPFMPHICQSC